MISRLEATTGSRLRRTALGGLAVVAVLGVTACQGDKTSSDASSSDSTASSSQSSESSSSTGSDSGDSAASDHQKGDKLSAKETAQLVSDALNKIDTAKMQMTTKTSSGPVKADGIMSIDPMEMQMTMDMMGQQMESRMVDGVMYMKMPRVGWVKTTAKDLAKLPGMQGLSDQLNPKGMIQSYTKAATGSTFKGTEQLDGEQADHYVLNVDTAKLLGAAAGKAKAAGMPETLKEDVYIDGEGRLTMVHADLGKMGTVDADYSDFGVNVDVKPPSGKVKDFSQLLRSAGGAGAGG